VTLVSDGLVVVDTHKDVHVAVVLDRLGQLLAAREFPTTDAGNAQLAG
jgi:transposase